MDYVWGLLNPPSKIAMSPQIEPVLPADRVPSQTVRTMQPHEQDDPPQSPSPDIEHLVDNMNEAAGKRVRVSNAKPQRATTTEQNVNENMSPRRSPRKRPAAQSGSPATEFHKRQRISTSEPTGTDYASSVPNVPTAKLPRRAPSGSVSRSVPRGDVFDMPQDEDDEAENLRSSSPPVEATKRRKINRKAITNPSPLKNQGVVEVVLNSNVNLADSPSKRPPGRRKKVDISAASGDSGKRPFTAPRPKSSIKNKSQGTKTIINTQGLIDGIDEALASQTTTKKVMLEMPATADLEGNVEEPDNAEEENDDERKAAETIRRRQEQRRQREQERAVRRAEELRGIEEIAMLHGCAMAWGELFVGAAALAEGKEKADPESEKGGEVCENLRGLHRRIGKNDNAQSDDDRPPRRVLKAQIENISQEIWKLRPGRGEKGREFPRRARDLYGHLVPGLVRALKMLLQTRQDEGELDPDSYRELLALLDAAYHAADTAYNWKPRPSGLEWGVLQSMRNDVRRNLTLIRERFIASLGRLERPILEQDRLKKFSNIQQEDYEAFMADVNRRRAAVLNRHRKPLQEISVAAASQEEIIDIDDLEIEAPAEQDQSEQVLPARPRPQRAQTDEIPGPVQRAWTGKERVAFTNALQHFTGLSRFEDILERYGGPNGVLERHDLDSLMSQASFIKQSMASQLPELGSEWEWLRSIPN